MILSPIEREAQVTGLNQMIELSFKSLSAINLNQTAEQCIQLPD
jgi:hypothetical protein